MKKNVCLGILVILAVLTSFPLWKEYGLKAGLVTASNTVAPSDSLEMAIAMNRLAVRIANDDLMRTDVINTFGGAVLEIDTKVFLRLNAGNYVVTAKVSNAPKEGRVTELTVYLPLEFGMKRIHLTQIFGEWKRSVISKESFAVFDSSLSPSGRRAILIARFLTSPASPDSPVLSLTIRPGRYSRDR